MYNAVRVARSTRAWIETNEGYVSTSGYQVARSTRAWIETEAKEDFYNLTVVARSTRAWIETEDRPNLNLGRMSHALRVRGLKRTGKRYILECIVARSTRAWIETIRFDVPE